MSGKDTSAQSAISRLYPSHSGLGEDLFVEERRITVKTGLTRVTFVETDKPVYKPGDRVRIRLLTVDALLKPVLGPIHLIWIENPAGVRMEQWTNVSRELGFASVSLTLSEEPVMGVWNVKAVDVVGGRKTAKAFAVKKYIPPKYEVSVTAPDFLVPNDERIKGRVCARYTYGKRVRGAVDLKIWRRSVDRDESGDNFPVNVKEELGEDGCYNYDVPNDRFKQLKLHQYNFYSKLNLRTISGKMRLDFPKI